MPDKMLGRAAQTAHPAPQGRFITPRQPAGEAAGAKRYRRFVTCYPGPHYPGAPFWSFLGHMEAQRSPPSALAPPKP
jgi:hypothetical protein